ncbi:MAG: hypothetical protein EBZ91_13990, partial [Gammaproteobacteria bacterium]|nr:hypothetical protein [Gammaproteobacteria bacterium]
MVPDTALDSTSHSCAPQPATRPRMYLALLAGFLTRNGTDVDYHLVEQYVRRYTSWTDEMRRAHAEEMMACMDVGCVAMVRAIMVVTADAAA